MLDLLLGDGKSVSIFVYLTLLSLPNIILAILPVSGLVAVIYLVNRLKVDNELVALQSAGISNFELSKPVLKLTFLLVVCMSFLSHYIVPVAKGSFRSTQSQQANGLSAMLLKTGEFFNPEQNVTMYISSINSKKEMENFFLEDSRNSAQIKTFIAKTAYIAGDAQSPQIVLQDGLAQTFIKKDASLDILYFNDFLYDFEYILKNEVKTRKIQIQELSTLKLLKASEQVSFDTGVSIEKLRFEVHNRIAKTVFPIGVIILVFSCVITRVFSRGGTWPDTLLAIGSAIGMQISANYFEDLSKNNTLETWGLYITPFVGIVIGLMLMSGWPNKLKAVFRKRVLI
jgi:lipopolysaccharide export system permease protein